MNWINVKDRLPEIDDMVLFFDRFQIYVGYLAQTGTYFINCNCHAGSDCFPTHWMPLPKSPEVE